MISKLEYSNGAEIPSSSCATELESAQRSSHLTFLAIGSDYEMSPLTSVRHKCHCQLVISDGNSR